MRKITSLILALVLLTTMLLTFTSCSEGQDDVTTIYVYNWGEYISDGFDDTLDVNKAFEDYYYETYGERVKVNYSTFSSNEDLYAKITSGSVSYDVIVPSDYMIQRLHKEGYLSPLNYENIPNVKNLRSEFYGENAIYDYYDEGNVYSVPYFYGMIGIIYNTDMVLPDEENIGSWELMWDEDYSGNILQFNNSRDAFGTAQYKLGIDVNSATEEEWRLAFEELRKQKRIVQGYVMDEIFNKMENGSAAIAAYYAGDYLSMYENNDKLEFYYPKEGTNLYVDAMCIPTTSKNQLIAERYIDFMLTEEIAIANAEYTYYASPNQLVIDSEEYREYMASIKPDAFSKMYDVEVPVSAYENLTEEKLVTLNSLWEELKSDVEIGLSIYIICGAIILFIIAFVLYYFLKKRKMNKIYDMQI